VAMIGVSIMLSMFAIFEHWENPGLQLNVPNIEALAQKMTRFYHQWTQIAIKVALHLNTKVGFHIFYGKNVLDWIFMESKLFLYYDTSVVNRLIYKKMNTYI
jgi:hypothetical protein